MTKTSRFTLFFIASMVVSGATSADIAIIVNPSNTAEISTDDIKSLFSGRQKSFSNGKTALLLSLEEDNPTRSEFHDAVLGKSDAQMKAYWSKLLFTGKGTPPKETSVAEMLELIADNPNTIGYIDAASVNGNVKVIATF